MLRNSSGRNIHDISSLRLLEDSCDSMSPIFEETYKQLRASMEKGRFARSKNMPSYYKGVMNTKGWIKFVTPSQFNRGKYYTQYIKLLDIKDLDALKDLKKKDAINLLLSGNIAVYCNCPDFLYKGYKYMAFNMGYGMFREMRFPKVKNPNLEGTVCKHVGTVLQVYMMNMSDIYRDLMKSDYFNKKYDGK
jgi:hypothetical protein